MKRFILLFTLITIAATGFSQFNDTTQLNNFIRDTIKDRRPDKVTALQLQKALLGVSNIAGGTIKNQSATKQTASAWVDSLKLQKLTLNCESLDPKTYVVANDGFGKSVFQIRGIGSIVGNPASLFIGDSAGISNIRDTTAWHGGFGNLGVGSLALRSNTTGRLNTAVGVGAMMFCTVNSWNTAFGCNALYGLVAGEDNTAVGQNVASNVLSGSRNAVVGVQALQYDTLGSDNAVVGAYAAQKAKGSKNVFIGSSTGKLNTGSSNVFLGYNVGNLSGAKSNRLYIHNNNTEMPLLYGEFDNQRFFVNGSLSVNDTSILNLDINKFYVNGSSKFSGNIDVYGTLNIKTLINLPATSAPTSSADPTGQEGDVKRDSSGNIYLKTNSQWLKFAGTVF